MKKVLFLATAITIMLCNYNSSQASLRLSVTKRPALILTTSLSRSTPRPFSQSTRSQYKTNCRPYIPGAAVLAMASSIFYLKKDTYPKKDLISQVKSDFPKKAADPKQVSLFHDAISSGTKNTVEALLKTETTDLINTPDQNGNCALHLAAKQILHATIEDTITKLLIARLLINSGASVNAKNNDGNCALHLAAQDQIYAKIVKLLINSGANPNEKNNDGNSALHFAAQNRSTDENVRLLINSGADVNAKNNNGDTVLHLACTVQCISDSKYSRKIVRLLIDNGADVNAKNNNGKTPLFFALSHNNLRMAKPLMETGALAYTKDLLHNLQPELHHMASDSYFNGLLRECVNVGDLNKKIDEKSREGLLYAAAFSNHEGLQILLDGGLYIDTQNRVGVTPILATLPGDCGQSLQLLLEAGGDPNIKNKDGETATELAVRYNSPKTLKILLDADTNPNLEKLIAMAINYKRYKSLPVLFSSLSDLSIKDQNGRPLIFRIIDHKFKLNRRSSVPKFEPALVVQMLLDAGLDPNIKNQHGRSPLEVALLYRDLAYLDLGEEGRKHRTVSTLVHSGSNSDLHILLQNCSDCRRVNNCNYFDAKRKIEQNIALIKWILENKDLVNSKDKDGRTPLHYALLFGPSASKCGHDYTYDLVKLLIEAGANPTTEDNKKVTPLHLTNDEAILRLMLKKNRWYESIVRYFSS